jgi:hypothetical protein
LLNRQHGWFGADGIFVLPANGVDKADSSVENTILFSDTMLGDIVNDRPKPGYIMIHNSVALLKGYEPKEEKFNSNGKKQSRAMKVRFLRLTPPMQSVMIITGLVMVS